MHGRKDSNQQNSVEDSTIDIVVNYAKKMNYYSDQQIKGLKQAFNKIRLDFPKLIEAALKHLDRQNEVVSGTYHNISHFPDYQILYTDSRCQLLSYKVEYLEKRQARDGQRLERLEYENKNLKGHVNALNETVLSLYEQAEQYAGELEELRNQIAGKKDRKSIKRSSSKSLFGAH